MTNQTTFGGELRKIRRAHGFNLADVADALGCTISYISDVERNQKNPPNDERIIQLMNFFGEVAQTEKMLTLAAVARKSIEFGLEDESPQMAEFLCALKRRSDAGEIDTEVLRKMLEALK